MKTEEFEKRFDAMSFENKVRYQLGKINKSCESNLINVMLFGSFLVTIFGFSQVQTNFSYLWLSLVVFFGIITILLAGISFVDSITSIFFDEKLKNFLIKNSNIRKKRSKK